MGKTKEKFPYVLEIKDELKKEIIVGMFDYVEALNKSIVLLSRVMGKKQKEVWKVLEKYFPETKNKMVQYNPNSKNIKITGEFNE
jgi:hypothetical protein